MSDNDSDSVPDVLYGKDKWRRLRVGCVYQGQKYVLSIRLKGDWLLTSGLQFGDYVTVELKDKEIIIRKFDL